MKLTPVQQRVLIDAERVVWDPPYGAWSLHGQRLSRRACEPLERAGLIERGKYLGSSVYFCRRTPAGDTALASHNRSTGEQMEIRFNNGSTVNRCWGDESTELMAAFQYEGDAVAFAKAKIAEDAKHNLGPCDYAVHCTYSGKLTMVRAAKRG